MTHHKKHCYRGYALTMTEVAKILKVSTKLVSRLIQSGDLIAVKVGREYRIAGENLDKFLKGKKEYVVTVTSNPQDWTLPENCGIVCATKTGTEG